MGDLHHLDLLELMLPNQPAHVLAVRARLAAETRRVGRVLQRQRVAVQDFVAMKVRQRHFRGRNQEQIPLAGDLEEVRFELRQLAGRFERRAIDEIRRHDLQVPVLARVQVEHEVGQRSRQPRARAEQQRRICAPDIFVARSKSRMPSAGPRSQCASGSKSNCRRLAPGAHDDVVRFALADGHRRMRQIGQRHQQ